ncbi:MAG TPA: magnesium transporter CorA family protein [Actinocatenispora sp.]
MARTRVYRGGRVLHDDLDVSAAADLIGTADTAVWIDLGPDDLDALPPLADRLGFHAMAIRDALAEHPSHSFARYAGHCLLVLRATTFDPSRGLLRVSPVAAFVTDDALVTVRRNDFLRADDIVDRWGEESELASSGSGFLLYGFLDTLSKDTAAVVRALDEALDNLADSLLDEKADESVVQRRSLVLRRGLVLLRRTIFPFEDALDTLTGDAEPPYDETIAPYMHGVYERVTRLADWTDSLRDMVATIVQTAMSLHDSRMTVISKKVSGWGALIAVPAVITGFFGINVPYPGINQQWGFVLCVVVLVASFVTLYAVFKHRDWL